MLISPQPPDYIFQGRRCRFYTLDIISLCMYLSLSLSFTLSIYIYICIYVYEYPTSYCYHGDVVVAIALLRATGGYTAPAAPHLTSEELEQGSYGEEGIGHQ